MSTDVTKQPPKATEIEPFPNRPPGHRTGENTGAIQIESERAVAEAQGQLVLAKKFPRDLNAAYAELMDACKMKALAQVAFYKVPNRGTGPSIRLAEEIARVYGNFEYGHRELSRSDTKSEVEVYAWDKEKNNRSIRQITVNHVVDTREGPRKLRDQKDIDDKIANVAAKQVRGRILALVPKWFSEAAQEECRKTLKGNTDEPLSVRVPKMISAFTKWGVKQAAVETYLGKPVSEVTEDDMIDLIGVYNSLNEGARVSEYFGGSSQEPPTEKPKGTAGMKAALKKKAAKEEPPPETDTPEEAAEDSTPAGEDGDEPGDEEFDG